MLGTPQIKTGSYIFNIIIMRLFLLIIGMAILVPVAKIEAANEGWLINNFDSQINIQSDGVVNVTESIEADFGTLAGQSFYRSIPYRYQNDDGTYYYSTLTSISVLRDQVLENYHQTNGDDSILLSIGDEGETTTGSHTYQIKYSVSGILRANENYDELYWNVTGGGWPITINKISATVTLPKPSIIQTSCFHGSGGANGASECETAVPTPIMAVFKHNSLAPSEGFTVAAGYSKGLVPVHIAPNPYPLPAPAAAKVPNQIEGALALIVGVVLALVVVIIYSLCRRRILKRNKRTKETLPCISEKL